MNCAMCNEIFHGNELTSTYKGELCHGCYNMEFNDFKESAYTSPSDCLEVLRDLLLSNDAEKFCALFLALLALKKLGEFELEKLYMQHVHKHAERMMEPR